MRQSLFRPTWHDRSTWVCTGLAVPVRSTAVRTRIANGLCCFSNSAVGRHSIDTGGFDGLVRIIDVESGNVHKAFPPVDLQQVAATVPQ